VGIELKDFRGRISPETDAVLEGLARATGRDRQEIARDVLHEWALRQIHAATVTHRLLLAEGLSGIDGGVRGIDGGSRGNVRECKAACGTACRSGGGA
jgi:predicted transcriptional regulator